MLERGLLRSVRVCGKGPAVLEPPSPAEVRLKKTLNYLFLWEGGEEGRCLLIICFMFYIFLEGYLQLLFNDFRVAFPTNLLKKNYSKFQIDSI